MLTLFDILVSLFSTVRLVFCDLAPYNPNKIFIGFPMDKMLLKYRIGKTFLSHAGLKPAPLEHVTSMLEFSDFTKCMFLKHFAKYYKKVLWNIKKIVFLRVLLNNKFSFIL